MKKTWLLLLMLALSVPLVAQAAKPMSPLQVSINADQSGLIVAAIKPGDVVNLRVTAKTYIDTEDLLLRVELHGGAQLISGDLSWLGSANKGEERVLHFSVRVPKQGQGRIKVKSSISQLTAAPITAESEYILGNLPQKKSGAALPTKKNSNGRMIREYPLN